MTRDQIEIGCLEIVKMGICQTARNETLGEDGPEGGLPEII
jgi:hypothetical protein